MISMDYEKLYNSYYLRIYSYVVTLVKNHETAEEITQNTFYKAMSTKAEFRGRSNEFTWLCSIAKNLCSDEFKKHKHTADISELDEAVSPQNVESSVENSDTAYYIHLILHGLEEPYKEVFQLRVFGELSFAQIAAIFGKTESWARVTYHRAKLKIQERMTENNGQKM